MKQNSKPKYLLFTLAFLLSCALTLSLAIAAAPLPATASTYETEETETETDFYPAPLSDDGHAPEYSA